MEWFKKLFQPPRDVTLLIYGNENDEEITASNKSSITTGLIYPGNFVYTDSLAREDK